MSLSKLFVLVSFFWMGKADGSSLQKKMEPSPINISILINKGENKRTSLYKPGIILSNRILEDCTKLQGILSSITDQNFEKNTEEKISRIWERVLLNYMLLHERSSKEYVENEDERKHLLDQGKMINQKLKKTLDQLNCLEKQNLLTEEFVLMLLTKRAICYGFFDTHEGLFNQDIVEAFEKNKAYPYLLQGFFMMHREKNREAACVFFQKAAQLGSEEAKIMKALCDSPNPISIMDNILHIVSRLHVLAGQITDSKKAKEHGKEFVQLFRSFSVQISLLNRSSLSEKDSEYFVKTWMPAYRKLMKQFFTEWSRIKASPYFEGSCLQTGVSGHAVSLDVVLHLETLIKLNETHQQILFLK